MLCKDETAYPVYRTKDYGKFKIMDDNRSVTKARARKIRESIDSVGYRKVPITVNKNFEVIDGQGRLEALKQLGCYVDYIIDEEADINVCRALNMGQTNWNPIDYVKSYAKDGNENYIRLVELGEEYKDFTLQILYGICKNKIMDNGWITSKIFSDGTLSLTSKEIEESIQKIEFARRLSPFVRYFSRKDVRLGYTICAWLYGIDGVNKCRLEELFTERYPLLYPFVDIVAALTQISDIYNKGLTKEKRIYFEILYKESL